MGPVFMNGFFTERFRRGGAQSGCRSRFQAAAEGAPDPSAPTRTPARRGGVIGRFCTTVARSWLIPDENRSGRTGSRQTGLANFVGSRAVRWPIHRGGVLEVQPFPGRLGKKRQESGVLWFGPHPTTPNMDAGADGRRVANWTNPGCIRTGHYRAPCRGRDGAFPPIDGHAGPGRRSRPAPRGEAAGGGRATSWPVDDVQFWDFPDSKHTATHPSWRGQIAETITRTLGPRSS